MDKLNKPFAKFKWAQNRECVYVLISVDHPFAYNIDIKPDYLSLIGPNYKELELFEEIDQSKSTYNINTSRNEIDVKLIKTNNNYWSQLYKQQSKLDKNWLSVDWDRWIPDYSEDEEDMNYNQINSSNLNDEQEMDDTYDQLEPDDEHDEPDEPDEPDEHDEHDEQLEYDEQNEILPLPPLPSESEESDLCDTI